MFFPANVSRRAPCATALTAVGGTGDNAVWLFSAGTSHTLSGQDSTAKQHATFMNTSRADRKAVWGDMLEILSVDCCDPPGGPITGASIVYCPNAWISRFPAVLILSAPFPCPRQVIRATSADGRLSAREEKNSKAVPRRPASRRSREGKSPAQKRLRPRADLATSGRLVRNGVWKSPVPQTWGGWEIRELEKVNAPSQE